MERDQFIKYAEVMKKRAVDAAPIFRTRNVVAGTALGLATGTIIGAPVIGGVSLFVGTYLEAGKLFVKAGKLVVRGGKKYYKRFSSDEARNQS